MCKVTDCTLSESGKLGLHSEACQAKPTIVVFVSHWCVLYLYEVSGTCSTRNPMSLQLHDFQNIKVNVEAQIESVRGRASNHHQATLATINALGGYNDMVTGLY